MRELQRRRPRGGSVFWLARWLLWLPPDSRVSSLTRKTLSFDFVIHHILYCSGGKFYLTSHSLFSRVNEDQNFRGTFNSRGLLYDTLHRDDPYHTVSFHGFDPFAKERLAIPL